MQTKESAGESRSIVKNEERENDAAWSDGWRRIERRMEGDRGGRERSLAAFGSRSVLSPSSWTSLVAGVNYWDWTRVRPHTADLQRAVARRARSRASGDSGSPCLDQQRDGEVVPDWKAETRGAHTRRKLLWDLFIYYFISLSMWWFRSWLVE